MESRERPAGWGTARLSAGLSRRAFVTRLAGLGAATFLGSCSEQAVAPSPKPRLRRIGYLSGNVRASVEAFSKPFRQKLSELGYVEGRDIEIDFRIADNAMDRLPAMTAELIALPVDVIVAEADPALRLAKQSTTTIPIVFTLASDPVGQGFIVSPARPGGNITGVTTGNLQGAAKRVEVLKETLPGLRRLAILWNANQSGMTAQVSATEQAARVLGIETQALGVRNPAETDAALDAIARQRFDGLLMLPTLSVVRDFKHVPERAATMRLPAIYSEVQIVRAGGLMHRSPDYADGHRRAAVLVDKILKGAHAADLPVEEPTQFLLAVNLSAAQRIGLNIPDSVRRQATEVVR
jgi:putative ABC transport system substrate-binding protein